MRKIDEIIIHCTATKAGQKVTVDDVNRWHIREGYNGIGYHYLIYLDGSIHTGRSIERVGAHAKGHNSYSIGVCYVGGLDKDGKPKDTRTKEQKDALKTLIAGLLTRYPTIDKISGHRDYSPRACPCFDVHKEYKIDK